MTVFVNGERRELPEGATLAGLLEQWGVPPSGVAVAVDGAVVTRASWAATTLSDGVAVEVLTAVQGG
ncbi:MAG: sulfur carrier protein ThiS [Pseudonocardiaceae bacterium]|nr:sulfur carrier protein ThiS [Pseudonocardiaceae bacterium]